jgi:photosystem II stability/assembly factor-like uncharacterized protein
MRMPDGFVSNSSYSTFDVTANDGRSAWACIVDTHGRLHIWHTTDAGATWHESAPPPVSGVPTDCHMLADVADPSTAMVVAGLVHSGVFGPTMHVLTRDGGATWRSLGTSTTPTHAFDFGQFGTVNGTIYAIRLLGTGPNLLVRLSTSRDGMQTWNDLGSPFASPVQPKSLWIAPATGSVLVTNGDEHSWLTTDGGLSWRETGGSTHQGADIAMPGANEAWRMCGEILDFKATGPQPFRIACSDNAGMTWHTLPLLEFPIGSGQNVIYPQV